MNILQTTPEGKVIVHRPLLDTFAIEQFYSQKDGVKVKYVCTTSLGARGPATDVFYRETPHPEFGNRYFGLWHNGGNLLITGADRVEDLTFDMIQDEQGHYHYSRWAHDFHVVDVEKGLASVAIDGGRDYTKVTGDKLPTTITFNLKDGEFYV